LTEVRPGEVGVALRTTLVLIHASAGVGGLVAGLGSVSPPRPADRRGWIRVLYGLLLGVLFITLVVLIAVDWSGLDSGTRVAFVALAGLAAVMVFRLFLARRVAATAEGAWEERYVNHVYFTYISLWVGFVILPTLNLPLPQLTVPAVALAVLLLGHILIGRYKKRILPSRAEA
jgi:hypothetical protein